MNTQKYKMSNCGLLSEADRTMYSKTDTVSKSCIDKERTADNYNLCPHEQYTASKIREMHEKIRGKKMRKDGVAFGSTIITKPKDYEGDIEAFFRSAYAGLKKMYKLRDEDIISAYVHMDETTPHMHFYFLPVVHEQEKDRISWETVMPRKMYQTQHRVLQKYMTERLGTPVNLLNGETKGVDMTHMTAEEKRLSMRQEKLQKSVGSLRKREAALVNSLPALEAEVEEERATLASLQTQNAAEQKKSEEIYKPYIEAQERLIKQFEALKPKDREKEQSTIEKLLKQSNRVFGDLGKMHKATAAMEKESSRLESTYLSIEDDDDFDLC